MKRRTNVVTAPELAGIDRALKRAADAAKKLADQQGTPFVTRKLFNEPESMFEIVEYGPLAHISIFGIGGCGNSVIEAFTLSNIPGVSTIFADTDSSLIEHSHAQQKLLLEENSSEEATNKSIVNHIAELNCHNYISELIKDTDLLFIVAGMGGSTGTLTAPIVAEIARNMGILTVAVVTTPFAFESNRKSLSMEGIAMLANRVDSLLIMPNERLVPMLGTHITAKEAYHKTCDILYNAVSSISEIINGYGLINVDFADIRSLMSDSGIATIGSAVASGKNRAREAANMAANSPFLETARIKDASGAIVIISASEDTFTMDEFYDVMNTIKESTANNVSVYYSNVFDNSLGDSLRITLIFTGLNYNLETIETSHRTGTHDLQ